MRKINTLRFRIWLSMSFLLFSLLVDGQQVIGSFPNMNGGFEGLTAGYIGTTLSYTDWSSDVSSSMQIVTTGARTGNNYATGVQSGTTALNIFRTAQVDNVTEGSYVIQFYYRGDKDNDAATENLNTQVFHTVSGITTTKTGGWLGSVIDAGWIKKTYTTQTKNLTSLVGTLYTAIRLNNTCQFDIDDYVVYAGTTVDVTAPSTATSLSFTPASNQIGVSWTAPSGGVDGGGYMVIRYAADPTGQAEPNVNGIYAVGNSIGTGTVVYLGTTAGFTDTGLSITTPYYYRVYTVDKAFNYSTALTGNSKTLATEPTAQVTGLNFTSITSSGMTINWTPAVSGGGTNHLVVVGTSLSGDPTDGSTYNANTVLGSGTAVAGGSVVYNGTGNSVTITGLSALTNYTVRVYDFNGDGGTQNYYISSPTSASQTTDRKTITSAQDGSFKTGSTWVGGVVPTADDYAVVAHNVEVTGSNGGSCYNLTINSGGRLYGNNSSFGAAFINVYGTSIQVDGTFDAAAGASEVNQTSIQFYQSCSITGNGTIKINRLKPSTNVTNTTFTFDANADIVNTSYCLIYDNSGNSNIGYTINSGKTVNITGQILSAATANLTINGTLNMLSGSIADFTNNNYCAGTGTINLNSGSILKIGAADGLNASTGPIRCTTRNFNSGASYQFVGSTAQVVGAELPGTIGTLTVTNAAGLTLNQNLTVSGSAIVNAGSSLTNTATFTASILNLKSNATGTGTYIDNGTSNITTTNVEQYIPSARNWYISSPVTAAKAKTGYTFYSRDETLATGTDGWVTMTLGDGTTTGDALTPGKGYIANLASGTATYSFTGTLNNGNVDVALTRTGATAQSGYNLVGNPYPSYINWDNATLTNVKTTIWQRSNSGSAYVFDTYNSSGNVAVDLSGNRTNGNIAPMQAFWVQVADGQTSGSVRFTNSMRAHKGSKAITGGTVNDPIFKVGASATVQPAMMRLQVSNGINTDETVLYQNENAQNSVDMYDSPKMSNSNAEVPEIYSLVNGNKLTINGVNSIDANTEFPLGFVTGQANSFSLKVSQLSNMNPELQVVLKDKVTGAQQVMTEGSVYNFTSDATSASDRFSVLFRSTSTTTGVKDIAVKNKFGVYVNDAGSIVVDLFDASATGTAAVYNIAGSRVAAQLLKASKSVLETKAASGIYMVKVSNGTLTETHRVIIK